MRNEGLIQTLQVMGYITIGLGIVVFIYLASSQGGLVGGETKLLLGLVVAFYHFLFGIMLIGVSKVLSEISESTIKLSKRTAEAREPLDETVCPSCKAVFVGDLRGQFCESCGAKLE